MKLPAHLYLEAQDIPYERRSFPPETEKGAANVACVLRFSERQAEKTLIFQADTGERVLVMLGGDFNSFTQADAEQIEEIYEQAGFIRASEASGNTIVKHGVGFPSDHIFAKGFVVKEAGKLEKAATSDHLPIWVTLVLQ